MLPTSTDGWAQMDELLQDDVFWRDVCRELVKQGHKCRERKGYRVCYDKETMGARNPPDLDEFMYNRRWLIVLIIDDELWN